MEYLDHFSHEHPLKLIDKVEKEYGVIEIKCDCCEKPFLDSPAYSCSQCKYFLHVECAELPEPPKEKNHPMHNEHPLTLRFKPPDGCRCSICKIEYEKGFTYHCSVCEFNVHVSCVLEEDDEIEHDGHHHKLTFVRRSAKFFCDACGTKNEYEDEDLSYRCTTCPFWIHNKCATSPRTLSHEDDKKHDLELAYSLPDHYRKYELYCKFCREKVQPSYWIYYCSLCRYFFHLKCAKREKKLSELKPLFPTPNMRGYECVEPCRDPDAMNFPLPNNSMDVISQFVELFRPGDSAMARKLNHPSHDMHHELTLFDAPSDIEGRNEEIRCNGCRRPISIPYYSCEQCNFFLHRCCAELPKQIPQHPGHPRHPLSLNYSLVSFPNFKTCKDLCKCKFSGFSFECSTCKDFCLDVECASLPRKINHDSHDHFLQLQAESFSYKCSACGDGGFGRTYKCETCGFNLHIHCASLPRTFKHEWDHHELVLSYPPFTDHLDDFICEICEEYIHPNYWLYRCRECDQSFHTRCIKPVDEFSNVKFGDTLDVKESHDHPLVYVRKSRKKSPFICSNNCRTSDDGWPIAECATCDFRYCWKCIDRQLTVQSLEMMARERGMLLRTG